MTEVEIQNAIRTRFKTLVADVRNLPTQYDNHAFDNPDNKLWCRLTINFGDSSQKSFGNTGNRRFRNIGVVTAQLFGPLGVGDKTISETAVAIKAAFRGVSDSSVVYRTPSIKRIGRVGSKWQINVNCPFYADDIG